MTGEKAEITLSVDQCRRAVATAIMADIPAAIWGEPGIGKSTVIAEICAKLDIRLFDFRMSDKDPTDAGGIPIPNKDRTGLTYAVTDMIPWEHVVGDDKAALVLDEFDRSEPAMQNMALQLVHDRSVNGRKLGKNVVVILAGNGSTDTYTTPLSGASASRMVHLYVSRTGKRGLESYEKWADANMINPHHSGFARFCHETWTAGVESTELAELGKPNPRTFDMAGKLYETIKEVEQAGTFATEDIRLALIAGCVGQESAHPYLAWRHMCENAPNPKDVINHPDTAEIPDPKTKMGTLFALIASLTDCAESYEDAEHVVTYLCRVSKEAKQEELSAMGFRRLIARIPEAATVTDYINWEEKHKALTR